MTPKPGVKRSWGSSLRGGVGRCGSVSVGGRTKGRPKTKVSSIESYGHFLGLLAILKSSHMSLYHCDPKSNPTRALARSVQEPPWFPRTLPLVIADWARLDT